MKNSFEVRVGAAVEYGRVVYSDAVLRPAIEFIIAIKQDARISPVHISLYLALLYCQSEQCMNPIYIFSAQVMPLAKISGPATYHRTIRQLHEYGYIKYVPSYYHLLGSLVYFPKKEGAIR
ncbi:MAG TPA: hypothetical protein VK543_07755 [Puia sp.]|nr:hypothetical protein [Puia sp.]